MRNKYAVPILTLFGMIFLILDAKTAFRGASDGIELCLQTVIPSLFPLCVLSTLLTNSLTSHALPPLKIISRLLRISPAGAYIFLSGILGGYPMGAQGIATAYHAGQINAQEGTRLLAFCNNAGPAFLFGIGMILFHDISTCFWAWGIHIVSALVVAHLTPMAPHDHHKAISPSPVFLSDALMKAVKTMALVCGWVTLFRVIICYLSAWIAWRLPEPIQTMIFGMMEISNGCTMLLDLFPMGLRFLLFTVFLSFGGLCVMLQVGSIIRDCHFNFRFYFAGKVTQAAITFLLAYLWQASFLAHQRVSLNVVLHIFCGIVILAYRIFVKRQKISSIPEPVGV